MVARTVNATDVEVRGSVRSGIFAIRRLTATNVVTEGNGAYGVQATRAKITGLTARGNGSAGLGSKSAHVIRGDITGNALPDGPDVLAARATLFGVTCSTRQRSDGDPPATLGVCQND